MGYNQSTSSDSIGKLGSQNYKSENKQIPHKLVLTPKGAEIADETTAELQATWLEKIKQATGRYYITPVINEIAETTTDPTEVGFANGDKRTIALADYSMDFYVDVPDAVVRELFTLNDKQIDGFIIWKNGLVEGFSDDNTKFKAKRIKEFVVAKRTIPDGSTVQRVFFKITFDEKDDFEKDTAYIDPLTAATPWDARELDSLRGVDLVASNAGSGSCDVTVTDETGVGVEGLVVADFTGSAGNPTGLTDNGGGSYSLTGLTAGANTINLVAAASISISDAFIESNGASNEVTILA